MNIREAIDIVTEYQVIDEISPKSQKDIQNMLPDTIPVGQISVPNICISIHEHTNKSMFILTEFRRTIVLGYFEIFPIDRSNPEIRQVKAAMLYDAGLRGKSVMPNCYLTIVQNKGWKLINDTMLTIGGEKLWQGLIKSGFAKSIYDVVEKKFYKIDQIGVRTSDGNTVIDPKDDNVPGPVQRFFYVIESKYGAMETPTLLEAYRRHSAYIELNHEHVMAGGYQFGSPIKSAIR